MNADPKILRPLPVDIGVSQESAPMAVSRPAFHGRSSQGSSSDRRMDQIAEGEYVKLVLRVFLRPTGDVPRVVVFSGIDPGNGCTRVCRQTAEVLAGTSSGTVCLVDAGFYSSLSQQAERSVPNPTEPLPNSGLVHAYVHEMETPNLWTLSPGCTASARNNPMAIDIARARLQELRQEFDRVLIDAPPLNQCDDAMALAELGDGLVVVIEANATRRQTARKVMETLGQAGVKVLGVVLNKRMFPIPEKLYRQL
jgi:Mrp family chromosome partitioning ATPase